MCNILSQGSTNTWSCGEKGSSQEEKTASNRKREHWIKRRVMDILQEGLREEVQTSSSSSSARQTARVGWYLLKLADREAIMGMQEKRPFTPDNRQRTRYCSFSFHANFLSVLVICKHVCKSLVDTFRGVE